MFDETAAIARIAKLERTKCAAAAEQARLTAELDESRRSAEAARGVPAARRGKGLASEIALARHDSPNQGGRHLGFARALVHEMPHTLAALEAGALSEWRATLIVRESACLSVEDRRRLDAELCGNQKALEGLGDKRIAADAKAIAYRLDPHAVVDRAVRAESERNGDHPARPRHHDLCDRVAADATGRVGLRRAEALRRHLRRRPRPEARSWPTPWSSGSPGGRPTCPSPSRSNLVITDETLLGGDTTPARVPGYGPIPAAIALRLVDAAAGDERSRATLRRLYKHPASGALVAMESRSRFFPKGLARFIALRDDTCRTPYCDAPIRHTDHADPHIRGGPTNVVNGRGSCEACNYAKQAPGWRVHGWTHDDGTHVVEFTTPTGSRHPSKAPPLPGVAEQTGDVEGGLADHLAHQHAA